MNHGPVPPHENDGMTDAELDEGGWAYGLAVWGPVTKLYGQGVSDSTVASSQLWSLRQAIRMELLSELHERFSDDGICMDYTAAGPPDIARAITDFAAGEAMT